MAFTYRTFRKTDIAYMVKVANLVEEQQNDPGRTTAERLEHLIATPHIYAEEDFYVALNAEDEIVGGTLFMVRPDTGMALADVIVHPNYQHSPIAAELVARSEARALGRVNATVGTDTAVHLNISVHEFKTYVREVLEAAGYGEVRRGYVMRIALNTPTSEPTFPTGYEFRPFDKARDGAAVYAVFQECFADHWGNITEIPYEQWAHQFEDEKFDPTLWYILYHHDAIAAICLCELSAREQSLGLVDVLGVRPVYRKQGLGGVLLHHAFHEFQARGFQHVALEVDTQNTTNALAVYERAGMSVYRCLIVYRKVLRGNPADIED